MNLRGHTAIVTGSAVRIGRAIAGALAAAGANVCLHCHSHRDEAEAAATELQRSGARTCVVDEDLSTPGSEARLFDRAAAELGPVDVLINSAAIFEPQTLLGLDRNRWRRHLAINLEAPAFLSHEFAKRLHVESSGAIVNIADWRAQRPKPGHLAYTIAKSGIVTLTKILAQELAPRIRVNAVAPGAILPAPGQSQAEFQKLGARNPLKRTGSASDVADAVLFLLTSPFINGEVVHVTGGEELS
jgi:NAD(P)-dependent dehydrogenase (short-subunit alcohol dehydrogenase family)